MTLCLTPESNGKIYGWIIIKLGGMTEVTIKTETPLTVNAYINGEIVESERHEPRENPAKPQETAGYWPLNSVDDAKRAIDAADEAFKSWKKTDLNDRIERMQKAIDKVRENQDDLVKL